MVAHGRIDDKVWQILAKVADHKLDATELRRPRFIPQVMRSVVTLERKWERDRDKKKENKKKRQKFKFTFNYYFETGFLVQLHTATSLKLNS